MQNKEGNYEVSNTMLKRDECHFMMCTVVDIGLNMIKIKECNLFFFVHLFDLFQFSCNHIILKNKGLFQT